jgi:hypothetical protein
MLKTIRDMILGAIICAAIGAAMATVGTPPGTGPSLIDGAWLNGLAGGSNYTYQYGISAAGTTQATGTMLPTGIYLIEIDTVASSAGVNLPPCIPGTQMQIYNNGANTLTIYPAVANNPLTSAQDTINNTTTLSLSSHTATSPACAKAGNWYAS